MSLFLLSTTLDRADPASYRRLVINLRNTLLLGAVVVAGCASKGRVVGEAATASGEPAAGLTAELRCDDEALEAVTLGEAGRFEFDDVPIDASCDIQVLGDGYIATAAKVRFRKGKKQARVDVQVTPLVRLSGAARGALTGEPIADCTVSLATRNTRTANDGTWALDHVAPGSYTVGLDCGGARSSHPVTLPPGQRQVATETARVLRFVGEGPVWLAVGDTNAESAGIQLVLPDVFRTTLREGTKITRDFDTRMSIPDAAVASARRRVTTVRQGARLAVANLPGHEAVALPLLWHDAKQVPCDWSNLKATIPAGWYAGFVGPQLSNSQIGATVILNSRRHFRLHRMHGETVDVGGRSVNVVVVDWPAGAYCITRLQGSQRDLEAAEGCHLVEVAGQPSTPGRYEGRSRR